jgi:hypothetical protein
VPAPGTEGGVLSGAGTFSGATEKHFLAQLYLSPCRLVGSKLGGNLRKSYHTEDGPFMRRLCSASKTCSETMCMVRVPGYTSVQALGASMQRS